jgi:hypothetical protein
MMPIKFLMLLTFILNATVRAKISSTITQIIEVKINKVAILGRRKHPIVKVKVRWWIVGVIKTRKVAGG